MNDELENHLRRALRPVAAPEGFTERLMARLPPPGAQPVAVPVTPPPAERASKSRWFALPGTLAASLLVAVIAGQQFSAHRHAEQQAREQAEGRAASRELMEALRVTSEKLDLAYQAVNNPPAGTPPGEENPS